MRKINSLALAIAVAMDINRTFKADLKNSNVKHNPRNNRKTKGKKK